MSCTNDSCFLYTPHGLSIKYDNPEAAWGFTCLRTDDSANTFNRLFVANEANASKRSDCKPARVLSSVSPVTFNYATILKHGCEICLSQPSHIKNLSADPQTPVDKLSFIAERARGANIAAASRPELLFRFSVCSQSVNTESLVVNHLNRFIHRAVTTVDTTLSFVSLNCKTIKLAVFTDASFAYNADISSQLGYIQILWRRQRKRKHFTKLVHNL